MAGRRCPLDSVRETSNFVMSRSLHVRINPEAVEKEAEAIASKASQTVIWDEEGMHFNDNSGTTVQGLLVLDALNFCFWPDADWEYDRLALSLKSVLCSNRNAMSGEALMNMTIPKLTTWLGGELPLMDERVRLLQEIGSGLVQHFDGKAENLVLAAGKSASRLVELITSHFPGFRDSHIYAGRQVFMYKRVQIFVGDVWGAFRGQGLGEFTDFEKITTFPDYRVPQLLRELGVMEYSAELAGKIDHKIEIEPGSREEIEIRAATVQSVEMIKHALAAKGVNQTSSEIDWALWQRGEQARTTLRPHHRTLTIFY